jgi:hypothetical protein
MNAGKGNPDEAANSSIFLRDWKARKINPNCTAHYTYDAILFGPIDCLLEATKVLV